MDFGLNVFFSEVNRENEREMCASRDVLVAGAVQSLCAVLKVHFLKKKAFKKQI